MTSDRRYFDRKGQSKAQKHLNRRVAKKMKYVDFIKGSLNLRNKELQSK